MLIVEIVISSLWVI